MGTTQSVTKIVCNNKDGGVPGIIISKAEIIRQGNTSWLALSDKGSVWRITS